MGLLELFALTAEGEGIGRAALRPLQRVWPRHSFSVVTTAKAAHAMFTGVIESSE